MTRKRNDASLTATVNNNYIRLLTLNTALDLTSIQHGDFTPANFPTTAAQSGKITNRRSDKSVMKQTCPYKHFSFKIGKLATDSSNLSFWSRQCTQIKRFCRKISMSHGVFTTASIFKLKDHVI